MGTSWHNRVKKQQFQGVEDEAPINCVTFKSVYRDQIIKMLHISTKAKDQSEENQKQLEDLIKYEMMEDKYDVCGIYITTQTHNSTGLVFSEERFDPIRGEITQMVDILSGEYTTKEICKTQVDMIMDYEEEKRNKGEFIDFDDFGT